MNNEVAQILLEAMNHSSVKKLKIGDVTKDTVTGCSYPTDKVKVEYYQTEVKYEQYRILL